MNGISNIDIMKTIFTLLMLITAIPGCTEREVNRDIYNALIQRECIKKTGEPNCDSGQPSYEEYRREVENLDKQE